MTEPTAPKEKACPDVTAPEQTAESTAPTQAAMSSAFDSITKDDERQGISRFLMHGEENAVPMRALAKLAGVSERAVRKAIEHERDELPIIASDDGYYLPSLDKEQCIQELKRFARRQDARLKSNRRSVASVNKTLKKLYETEIDGQERIGGM